jgi:hypothetical protein
MHRQHVDDVGPVVALFVAVAEQLGSDRVAVGLVMDQDTTEPVASSGVEHLEDGAEVAHLWPVCPTPESHPFRFLRLPQVLASGSLQRILRCDDLRPHCTHGLCRVGNLARRPFSFLRFLPEAPAFLRPGTEQIAHLLTSVNGD